MNSPNVVKFIDAFFENGLPYIVTEYCENGNLWDYVNE